MGFHDRRTPGVDWVYDTHPLDPYPADEWRPATLLELWPLWLGCGVFFAVMVVGIVWAVPKI